VNPYLHTHVVCRLYRRFSVFVKKQLFNDFFGNTAPMANKDEESYFQQERNRLSAEITSGFEELLSLTNVLNRQVEEVFTMSAEYDTVASLWNTFHSLVQEQDDDHAEEGVDAGGAGVPGTGTHVVSSEPTEYGSDN